MNFVDQGFAIVIPQPDGSRTVAIATGLDHGEPLHVIAKHVGVTNLRVDPDVTFRQSGSRQYTTQMVEVAPDGTALRIRAVPAGESIPL